MNPTRSSTSEDLTVDFRAGAKSVRAVAGVDLTLDKGERVALLGESGSGKSVTLARADAAASRSPPAIGGTIAVDGRDVLAMSPRRACAPIAAAPSR